MVNFHNPVTIIREFGAYALLSGSGDLPSLFSTAATVNIWHTVDGIFMCVSLQYPASRALLDYSTPISHLAGNSLLPSTMNGM
jgi:hypothetical protein